MLKVILFISLTFAFANAQVGNTAPDFTLDKLNGGTESLSSYLGKVVYINWFGYSCPTCLSEGNATQTKIVNKYGSDVFKAMGIDVWNGSASGVQNFKNSTGVSYYLLLNGGQTASDFGTQYQYSMVIDQKGVIQLNVRTSQVTTINAKIDELLAVSAVKEPEPNQIKRFELQNNYPNPFNPSTRIPFTNDRQQRIKLAIYDITGREVAQLINAVFAAGSFEFQWNGRSGNGIPAVSGVYFVRLIGETSVKTRSILLLK